MPYNDKVLDGIGLSVVNDVFNTRLSTKANTADLGTLASKNTVEKTDLDAGLTASINKADTALQSYTETDPTVPAWAKSATKPTYTATEVGAVPITQLDSLAKKSDLTNVYIYKGSVATFADLPSDTVTLQAGWVYNVEADGMNYGWTGTAWDALGSSFTIKTLTAEEIRTILGVNS